jgi:hypothetical protein
MSHVDLYTALAAGANIALAVLGAVVAVYEKWTKKHRSAILVSFVVLGCVGFVTTILAAAKSARDLQEANDKVTHAVDEAKKEELAATTGGDTVCYAQIDLTKPIEAGRLYLYVIRYGEHPLYNVNMFFYDPQKAMQLGMLAMKLAMEKGAAVPDLQGNLKDAAQSMKLETPFITDLTKIDFAYQPLKTDSQVYSFGFSGLNGHWDETLRLERVEGKWIQAFKVTKDIPSPDRFLPAQKKTVVEHVDDGFSTPMNWEGPMRVNPVPNHESLK